MGEIDKRTLLEFEKSLELRNMEISNFWKRGWFFGALILALFTLYLNVKTPFLIILHPNIDISEIQIPNADSLISVLIAFLLEMITLIQALINRGSKYWQERWEYKVKNREAALGVDITSTERFCRRENEFIQSCIKDKHENVIVRARRISVSKLAMLVWDLLVIFFFFLWLNDFIKFSITSISNKNFVDLSTLILSTTGIIIYIFYSIKNGRFRTERNLKEIKTNAATNKEKTEIDRINKMERSYVLNNFHIINSFISVKKKKIDEKHVVCSQCYYVQFPNNKICCNCGRYFNNTEDNL